MSALKEWLTERKTTQAALAEELGVSTAHLSRIVNGDPRLSLAVAAKLERVTGIPAARFARPEREAS